MNDKLITILIAILLALGGWNLKETYSISKDMVLLKEKVNQIEKSIGKKFKKKKKKKNNWNEDNFNFNLPTFSWM